VDAPDLGLHRGRRQLLIATPSLIFFGLAVRPRSARKAGDPWEACCSLRSRYYPLYLWLGNGHAGLGNINYPIAIFIIFHPRLLRREWWYGPVGGVFWRKFFPRQDSVHVGCRCRYHIGKRAGVADWCRFITSAGFSRPPASIGLRADLPDSWFPPVGCAFVLAPLH